MQRGSYHACANLSLKAGNLSGFSVIVVNASYFKYIYFKKIFLSSQLA